MWIDVVNCKRGPHHPKSEIDADRRNNVLDEHLIHADE